MTLKTSNSRKAVKQAERAFWEVSIGHSNDLKSFEKVLSPQLSAPMFMYLIYSLIALVYFIFVSFLGGGEGGLISYTALLRF